MFYIILLLCAIIIIIIALSMEYTCILYIRFIQMLLIFDNIILNIISLLSWYLNSCTKFTYVNDLAQLCHIIIHTVYIIKCTKFITHGNIHIK